VHVYNNSGSCSSFLQFQQWKVAKRKSSHTRRAKTIKAIKRNATTRLFLELFYNAISN